MKALILAGGFGTRLAEETVVRPKPMVEIGGRPILWHIMRHYSEYGINEFVICLGYKSEFIKKFFLDYAVSLSDFTVSTGDGTVKVLKERAEDWKVTLLDTGHSTMTGGRIKRAINFLELDETFLLTYGDGLSNVNIRRSIDFHKSHKKLATVTAVTPPGRFGVLDMNNHGKIDGFREKIASDQYKINGGFFVLEPEIVNYIEGDDTVWENAPLERLAADGEFMGYEHNGFWQPMDTIRDRQLLEKLWETGNPPWRKSYDQA